MAIGMTYEQYWYGDVHMARAFYKAHKLKREMVDEEAWLNGSYVYMALDSTVGNAFRGKGKTPVEYPKEPMSLTERKKAEAEREKTEREKEQEAVWALAWMSSFVNAGKNWGKNKKQKG